MISASVNGSFCCLLLLNDKDDYKKNSAKDICEMGCEDSDQVNWSYRIGEDVKVLLFQ